MKGLTPLCAALFLAGAAFTRAATGPILLDIGVAGHPVASAADFSSAGVTGLSGSETVGNVGVMLIDEESTSFTFSTGQTMTFGVRAQGGFSKDLGNEMLNDYMYLELGQGHGGPIHVTLGNLGLEAGTAYTLHLFGSQGSENQLSAFTPINNAGITFTSSLPSNGNLVVGLATSPSYAGEVLEFTWTRAAGSPNFAAFNGIAIRTAGPGGGGPLVLNWKCSTPGSVWSDKPAVSLAESIPFPDSAASRIVVNSSSRLQRIDGWGGCFNERGWKAMEVLSPAARASLMSNLFGAEDGLNLNLCRTPIGASDYAIDLYSLNETAGDLVMTHFSIDRDRERLIPFIKAAQAIRPDLKLWASPWSPPSWMKNNSSLAGPGADNRIKDDHQTFDALALYFARYVEAYAAEGVNISMVMPQNEPNMTTTYTSCLWTGSQLARFIGYHLGPTFASRGLAKEIYLGSINDDNDAGGHAYWVEPSMRDPEVAQYINGLGCQWDSDDTMAETHVLFPQLKLMQTEAECGNHENNWTFAEYQYGLARKWFGSGASSNILWNLVLDETGLSTGGWAQCSPVVVNSTNGQVTYTPFFHFYKHFSHFIQPGAHIATSFGSWADRVVFVNPDGSVAVVVANRTNSSAKLTLNIDGKRTAPITIPARSFNTFTSPATTSVSAIGQWRSNYFGATENQGDGSDNADPDADGLVNLLEFSLGLDPTRSQNSPIRAHKPSGSGTFEYYYQRNRLAVEGGVGFIVEWSDNMEEGSWSPSGFTESILSENGLIQEMKATFATTSDTCFARLRVSF